MTKPVRVRKARRSGACPACRRLVLIGDLVASVNGAPFTCLGHVTRAGTDTSADELAALAALMSTPPPKGHHDDAR